MTTRQSVPDVNLFYTPAEVAEIMRVSRAAVVRWCDNGDLRSIRTPGRHRRIFRADVDAMVSARPALRVVDASTA